MERSEPTLFPEWLRSTGSVTGGGSSSHHSASTASHSGTIKSPSCTYLILLLIHRNVCMYLCIFILSFGMW